MQVAALLNAKKRKLRELRAELDKLKGERFQVMEVVGYSCSSSMPPQASLAFGKLHALRLSAQEQRSSGQASMRAFGVNPGAGVLL